MMLTLVLHFLSVFSAVTAAALWMKSAAIRMPTPHHTLALDHGASHANSSVSAGDEALTLSALDAEFSRLAPILRTQSRWNARGARFAALAILLQALGLFL